MALRKTDLPDIERDQLLYPADDGIPMEDCRHVANYVLLMQTLSPWLEARRIPHYVAGNNFIYYQHGDPKKNVGPDFFAVLGAKTNPDRDCWRLWHENDLKPQVIVEMLSKSNKRKDRVVNFAIYRDVLKVQNYFMVDHRKHVLEGYVLRNGVYVRLLPDANGRLYCEALDLWLGFDGYLVRWFTSEGEKIPTAHERAERELKHAEAERQHAEAERQHAEAERQRADQAEEEVARLREELQRLRRGSC